MISHAAHFLFLFWFGLLAVPLSEWEFRECAALLLPPARLSQQGSGKRKEMENNGEQNKDGFRHDAGAGDGV